MNKLLVSLKDKDEEQSELGAKAAEATLQFVHELKEKNEGRVTLEEREDQIEVLEERVEDLTNQLEDSRHNEEKYQMKVRMFVHVLCSCVGCQSTCQCDALTCTCTCTTVCAYTHTRTHTHACTHTTGCECLHICTICTSVHIAHTCTYTLSIPCYNSVYCMSPGKHQHPTHTPSTLHACTHMHAHTSHMPCHTHQYLPSPLLLRLRAFCVRWVSSRKNLRSGLLWRRRAARLWRRRDQSRRSLLPLPPNNPPRNR